MFGPLSINIFETLLKINVSFQMIYEINEIKNIFRNDVAHGVL